MYHLNIFIYFLKVVGSMLHVQDQIIAISFKLLCRRVDFFINHVAELASSNNSECNFLASYTNLKGAMLCGYPWSPIAADQGLKYWLMIFCPVSQFCTANSMCRDSFVIKYT